MTPALKIQNLTVSIPNRIILENINLEISPQSFVFLFGANGSGKTSLLKTILNLKPIEAGNVEIFGSPTSRKIVSESIGYVPQYTNISRDFPINVRELIELECSFGPECALDIKEHLELLNLTHLLDRKISDLSGGEFQKVLIARALVTNPKILILDEPFNNLDENSQMALIQFLEKINKERQTSIILISHDFEMTEKVGNAEIYAIRDKTIIKTDGKHIH